MQDKQSKQPQGIWVLVGLAAFVVVVAGMKVATDLIVPFILSVFIAIICVPLLSLMKRWGLPTVWAVLAILVGVLTLGVLLATFVSKTVVDFTSQLPAYQERLTSMSAGVVVWLADVGVDIPRQNIAELVNPAKAMGVAAKALSGLSGALKNVFLITLTVVFILFEAAGFPDKMRAALGDPEATFKGLDNFTKSLNQYLAIKTAVSLGTGLVVWGFLAILGIDYSLLWGLLAFILNYVPNIGSFLAAVPAVLLAIVQYGFSRALIVIAGYAVVNVVFGNFIEPKFLGKGLGLSTLVVFLSLVFWGWVLGPVGMVLSVPLTIVLKIGFESSQSTKWIAVMLGPSPDSK